MKQHLSPDDLRQLTPAQQEKLRELWKPQIGNWAVITGDTLGHGKTVLITKYHSEYGSVNFDFIDGDGFGSHEKKDLTPLLSVGQCIELLGARLRKIDYDGFVNNYYVQTNQGTNGKPELIDALWEALKSIL